MKKCSHKRKFQILFILLGQCGFVSHWVNMLICDPGKYFPVLLDKLFCLVRMTYIYCFRLVFVFPTTHIWLCVVYLMISGCSVSVNCTFYHLLFFQYAETVARETASKELEERKLLQWKKCYPEMSCTSSCTLYLPSCADTNRWR